MTGYRVLLGDVLGYDMKHDNATTMQRQAPYFLRQCYNYVVTLVVLKTSLIIPICLLFGLEVLNIFLAIAVRLNPC